MEALNWRTSEEDLGGGQAVIPAEGAAGLRLRFVPASRPKASKNRLHLDLGGGPDPAQEVDRLLALGASSIDIGQGEVPWTVLADPEGNEFCVLPERGSEGRLAAICLDAADPGTQARFWGAALGWPVVDQGGWAVCLRSPAMKGPRLVMGPPVAAKAGRNRLLLEIAPSTDDLALDVERLVGAGAVETGIAGEETLADPEANEFVIRATR
jgi:Glyoxalase-like domain